MYGLLLRWLNILFFLTTTVESIILLGSGILLFQLVKKAIRNHHKYMQAQALKSEAGKARERETVNLVVRKLTFFQSTALFGLCTFVISISILIYKLYIKLKNFNLNLKFSIKINMK